MAEAIPASTAMGTELLRAVRTAMGGDALAAVNDYSLQVDLAISMGQGDMSI